MKQIIGSLLAICALNCLAYGAEGEVRDEAESEKYFYFTTGKLASWKPSRIAWDTLMEEQIAYLSQTSDGLKISAAVDERLLDEVFHAVKGRYIGSPISRIYTDTREIALQDVYRNIFQNNSFAKGLELLQYQDPEVAYKLLDLCNHAITVKECLRVRGLRGFSKEHEPALDAACAVLQALKLQVPAFETRRYFIFEPGELTEAVGVGGVFGQVFLRCRNPSSDYWLELQPNPEITIDPELVSRFFYNTDALYSTEKWRETAPELRYAFVSTFESGFYYALYKLQYLRPEKALRLINLYKELLEVSRCCGSDSVPMLVSVRLAAIESIKALATQIRAQIPAAP